MKRSIYIHRQASIFLPSNYVAEKRLKSGVYKFVINGVQAIGKLSVSKKPTKEGRILVRGTFSVSKNIIDYMKLKNKQEVEFEIL